MDTKHKIPVAERSQNLKPFLFRTCREIVRLIKADRSLLQPGKQLLFILAPWLFGTEELARNAPVYDTIRVKLCNLAFDGAKAANELKQAFWQDGHLQECCGMDILLADFLDEVIVPPLTLAFLTEEPAEAEEAWDSFERLTFDSGRFQRNAYTHVFNFPATGDGFEIGNLSLRRLPSEARGYTVGKGPIQPLFHADYANDFFIVASEFGPCPDLGEWLRGKRGEALELTRTLQLQKDAIIHATFTIPYLLPAWVNRVRRFDLSLLGEVRFAPYLDGKAPYRLSEDEITTVRQWWEANNSPTVRTRMSADKNWFRQLLLRAAEYYSSSLKREKSTERLVDLAICLESMFTPPSARTELTFRISQGAAQLVGSSPKERVAIHKSLKRLYERRSALFHGQYDVEMYATGRFVTADELDTWSSIIRRALVRMTVAYLKGEDDNDLFLNRLSEAALSPVEAERIRSETDPSTFLQPNVGASAQPTDV